MGIAAAVASSADSSGEPSGGAVAFLILGMLVLCAATLAFPVWNFGYRQGKTGQSLGKQVMKFKVVSEKTGQPIGFGMSLVRQLAHVLDSFFYIGYLMPLWDGKRQTIADKALTTVCVPAPSLLHLRLRPRFPARRAVPTRTRTRPDRLDTL